MTDQMEVYLQHYAKCLLPATLGVSVNLDQLCFDVLANDVDGYELKQEVLSGRSLERMISVLFNEELGAVVQIRTRDHDDFMKVISEGKDYVT